jgi:hypothetical protein
LRDLIELLFEPIDVGILVAEDFFQQRPGGGITDFIGQMDDGVIVADRLGCRCLSRGNSSCSVVLSPFKSDGTNTRRTARSVKW